MPRFSYGHKFSYQFYNKTEREDPRTAKCYRSLVKTRAELTDRLWRLRIHPVQIFEMRVPEKYREVAEPMLTVFGGDVCFDWRDLMWWQKCVAALERGEEFKEDPPRVVYARNEAKKVGLRKKAFKIAISKNEWLTKAEKKRIVK